METIAVYWEETIRTYGFNLLETEVMCRVSLPVGSMTRWGRVLQQLGSQGAPFRLVWCQVDPPRRFKFFLLCDDEHWQNVRSALEGEALFDSPGHGWEQSTVDALFFQGPHFGDRYGILDFTLKALAAEKVPLIAGVCSVASIYLVLPAGWGTKARTFLSRAFEIPREKRDVGSSSS